MLAQIDAIPGVLETRVNWTGERVLVRLASDASEDRVAAEASRLLGENTRRLDGRAEAEALATYRGAEPWLRSDETSRLSRREAQVLAAGFGAAVAGDLSLDESQTQSLIALLEEEIAAAFERIRTNGEGLRARMPAETRVVIENVSRRSRAFLTAEQALRVEERLERVSGVESDDCCEDGACRGEEK